jgi:hypothetical protein
VGITRHFTGSFKRVFSGVLMEVGRLQAQRNKNAALRQKTHKNVAMDYAGAWTVGTI